MGGRVSSESLPAVDGRTVLLAGGAAVVAAVALPKAWSFGRWFWHARKLPAPSPCGRLSGHLGVVAYGPKTVNWLRELAPEWRTGWAFWLGPVVMIFRCVAPDEIEVLVKTTNFPKGIGYHELDAWLGMGLLTNAGPDHLRKRRLLTPSFHFEVVDQYREIFGRNTAGMLQLWLDGIDAGRAEIDVQGESTFISLDNAGEACFGIAFNAVHDRSKDNGFVVATLGAASTSVKRFLANPIYTLDVFWWNSALGREHLRHVAVLRDTAVSALENRRVQLASGSRHEKKYFLDILLDSDLSQKEMCDEINTFMFEAHDTTSSGIMFSLYSFFVLMCDGRFCEGFTPSITTPGERAVNFLDDYVRPELDRVFGDKPLDYVPTKEDLDALEYLTMGIRESLRAFPPVPNVARRSTHDIVMPNGAFVPKGSNMAIAIYSLHHNPDVWESPTVFDPFRFTQENVAERTAKYGPYAYIPFSAGARNCIGLKFAMTELKVVLAMVLRAVDLTFLVEPQPYLELVLRSFVPLTARVSRRK